MNDDLQYDSSLGGTQQLPNKISLLSFTAARAKEIHSMKQALQCTTGTKLAFQRLPNHMRRRIMSHNVKRLPRRLREIHLSQLKKSGMPPKQKRPSRKYRRRPHNLLNEYARRQGKHKWLETHIWHAKRFHMTEKWGCRLADRPCDKAFRACYRATTKHCLVQDISYFSCIEINGPSETLISSLKNVCDSSSLSIGAKAYITGKREGETVLYNSFEGARRAIGTVYFHWKPVDVSEAMQVRVLWLWVHAAYYDEVLSVLTTSLNLKSSNEQMDIYINELSNVKLVELKNQLNRFRLTGPLSIAILYKTLKTVTLAITDSGWFKDYMANGKNSDIFLKQCEYWKTLENVSSSAELPPNMILSLTVIDPRFNLPQKRTKAILQWNNASNNFELIENLASGPIWEPHVKNSIRKNKLSNAKFAEMRSNLLVPGTELEEVGEAIPIMLIQRPGTRSECLGYGSGWDIIIPSGWGNTFWLSLILWGGRAGGLQEFNSVLFESGKPPLLMPDTPAGVKEEKDASETYQQKFFSLPPNKRPNYIKLGILQPFEFNWKVLIENWHSSPVLSNGFFVLRDRKILQKIKQQLNTRNKTVDDLDYNLNCLVPVKLKLKEKGVAKMFSLICLSEPNDLKKNSAPTEPLRKDKNQKIRKEMRHNHKELLKRLRRRRVRAKRQGKMIPNDVEMLKKYKEEMRKLWLPERGSNIRHSCTREIMGFVTTGSFSYVHACSCAIGYVAMGAIRALSSQTQSNTVLLRNTTSRQYRAAYLEVIV